MKIQYLLVGVDYETRQPQIKGVFDIEENPEEAVTQFLTRQYGVDGYISTSTLQTKLGTRTYYSHSEGPDVQCGYHAVLDPIPINVLFADEEWVEEESNEEE